jgi:glycosyltransferase involved in cell wall biosynthesis
MNMRKAKYQLSCIIPVYNEAGNVSTLLQSLKEVCERLKLSWEAVLVDDGSSDDSWDRIRELTHGYSNLSAVRLSRNFGKESAIYAGLVYAWGETLVVIDSDLQHPPELIEQMWMRLHDTDSDSRVEIVSAVKQRRQRESVFREAAARIFYWLFLRSTGIDLKSSTDFKMMTSRVRSLYLSLPERYRFFRGLTNWFGLPEATVQFTPPDRLESGTSRWTVSALSRYAVRNMISFSSLPIRLLAALGGITLLFALGLGGQTLFNWIQGEAIEGFTTVILTLLIIGSILIIGLSIIGAYVAEIFHQVRQRPSFIVWQEIIARERPDIEVKDPIEQ